MDHTALKQIIDKIPELKYKFIGTFPADFIPNLVRSTFCIINTDNSSQPGEHWIMVANYNGTLYYGDSMGKPIHHYSNFKRFNKMKKLTSDRMQNSPQLCGFYCVYFAWVLFKLHQKHVSDTQDVHVLRFISNFM